MDWPGQQFVFIFAYSDCRANERERFEQLDSVPTLEQPGVQDGPAESRLYG